MALHLVTGHAGAEHVTGADQGSLNIGLIGSGQFVFDRGSKFAASIYSNNIIRIADGDLIMQGRHIRQKEKTYEECVFENGTQGMLRNDLICVRYTKDDSNGVENVSFVVLKGQEVAQNPVDPTPVTGDITEEGNALINEMPLYRVPFVGLTIQEPVKLFNTISNYIDFVSEVNTIMQTFDSEIDALDENMNALNTKTTEVSEQVNKNSESTRNNSEKIVSGEEKISKNTLDIQSLNEKVTKIIDGTETVGKAENATNAEKASNAENANTANKIKDKVKIGNADFDGSSSITLKDMGVYEIVFQNTEPTEVADNTIVFVYEE